MEHTLRCNVLKCRKELNDHAVVTTCSHVFCIDCANRCQISGQREGQRPSCPACHVSLTNPDDVVVTNLNPTEDYKTSVLSGLHPNIIMECAGRALSFWAYQSTQEITYHEYLAKNLTDKYASLNTQMDKIIHDANGEISNLRNKMSSMQFDQDGLRRKNEELVQAIREKSRKQLQTQELYDKLKRRAMLGEVQNAALDAVDHNIQASVVANRFVDRVDSQNQPHRPPPPPLFSNHQTNGMQHAGLVAGNGLSGGAHSGSNEQGEDTWAGFSSHGTGQQNQPIQTPSTHRQRLASGNIPPPRIGQANLPGNGAPGPLGAQKAQHRASPRQPLANINGNSPGSGFAGYGMSAGLKVSNPAGSGVNAFSRPVVRSRVAQRPGSGFTANRTSAFGPSPAPNMFSNGSNYY
ncbi:hypothetical protein L207DRAFT_473535 [Hyaloscypha variabilis F]|uniref:RING-type domain-containing protein n=1 Tax=Hyaloscypha variabilis (strain UAMH 11265 / GT02V1 / F) TaxID=1149755 RepID=A0A2J6QWD2_HYAVF|nr:hypothetical protein L207DRAFT_473535 [Hyaloscypha variabilis F]